MLRSIMLLLFLVVALWAKVNLNTASAEELATLKGIGEKKPPPSLLAAKPTVGLKLYHCATAFQMLVSTVNASIGNEAKHLGANDIKKLFMGKNPEKPVEKYALEIIKTEALKEEVEDFALHFKIPMKKVNKVLH